MRRRRHGLARESRHAVIIRRLMRDKPVSQINNPNDPLYQAIAGWIDGPAVNSGMSVNQDSAMRVIAVNACVKLIAETIASLPLQTFNRSDDAREPIRRPAEAYIWDQPNPEHTPMEFWEQIFCSLLLDGNAFIETVRYRNGTQGIAELWPIEPLAVNIGRTKDGRKVFEIPNSGTYDTSRILHIPALRRPGQERGMSPIAAAREGIGVAVASERLAARFFGHGSVLSGLLEVGADWSNKPDLVDATLSMWNQMHSGTDNAFKVALLDKGVTFRQLSIPPEDLQFMEARKFQVIEICRLFQVPPHMVAEVERSTSWGTGIEQQGIQFVIYCLLRWAKRTEQAVSKFLLPPRERYARWNFSALLRGDSASRATFYAQGRTGGWLSINDVRRLEELPPIDNGDDYLQPMNMSVVGEEPEPEPIAEPVPEFSENGARHALAR
jgi:HK97 family phage portal protein